VISILLTGLPPSSNHAYFNLPKGGRTLTKGGKKYKTETSTYIMQNFQPLIRGIKLNHPYGILFGVELDILNKTWPETAKTRYKRLDVDNRVKLLQDAVVEALGIDDSQMMSSGIFKRHSTEVELTYIVVFDCESENVNDAITTLGF
jgi:Holliday junction resolvase RusA-like endonuclease